MTQEQLNRANELADERRYIQNHLDEIGNHWDDFKKNKRTGGIRFQNRYFGTSSELIPECLPIDLTLFMDMYIVKCKSRIIEIDIEIGKL
jgi:hypothetical protein